MISFPASTARPLVGARYVVRIRIEVVLPAPFGPSSPTISPRPTWKLICSIALNEP